MPRAPRKLKEHFTWGPFTRSDLERIIRLATEDMEDWKTYKRRFAYLHRAERGTPEYMNTMGAAQERIVHDRRIIIKVQLCLEAI